MKRIILIIVQVILSIGTLSADNEPDFYYEGIGYNILSLSDQTCEIGKSSYGGEVVTKPIVEYKGKKFTVLGVGKQAFYMSRCTKATIGNGLKYIGDDAFAICNNLRKIVITPSIVDLGSCSFGYNDKLEEVVIEDDDKELVFQQTMLNFCPFERTSIKKLYIGRNHSADIFKGKCNNITDLQLGDGITKFELTDFPSLRRLTIGKNLTFLPYLNTGDYLTEIKVFSPIPQNIGGFTKRTCMNAILYVPNGTKELYEKAPGWSDFWDIREFEITQIKHAITNKATVTQEFSIDGSLSSRTSKGIKILKRTDGTCIKIIKK